MDAAPIQWRPLGQMLVERGLLTSDELEEVLRVQHQSGKPLGQIIVDRGLISAPTLAVTLAEQCGVELETDKGFGTGLWTAIQARHKAENRRRSDLRVVPAPDEPVSDAPPAVEQDGRERELAEREEAITGRQRAILTAAADLEQRRRSLEERERELVEVTAGRSSGPRPDEVVPPSNEVQEFAERHLPTAPERPSAADGYRWNLDTLTRLVEEGADEFPDRADEWRYTLFYLRNEARVDGALPTKFDSLVEECFGELLATSVSPGSSA